MIDDEKIIELFFERSEQAIRELDIKYGKICHNLSYNIVNSRQDAEECVNDAYGEEILTQLIQALQTAKTGRLLWSEDIISLNKRIADIASQERLLAQLKQQAIVDPDIFISRSNQLAEQRREAKLKKSHILRAEDDQTIQRTQELLDILEEGPDLLMAFDGALFSELVEKITIQNNSTAIFRLINGLELPEHFERRK